MLWNIRPGAIIRQGSVSYYRVTEVGLVVTHLACKSIVMGRVEMVRFDYGGIYWRITVGAKTACFRHVPNLDAVQSAMPCPCASTRRTARHIAVLADVLGCWKYYCT